MSSSSPVKMGVKINMGDLVDLLKRQGVDLEREITQGVYDAADMTLAQAMRTAPVDRGTLRTSGHVIYGPGAIAVVNYQTPYARPVEFGSKPHMPPVKPLQDWAQRHGSPDPQRAGWAIAQKIKTEGTQPKMFLTTAVNWALAMLSDQIKRRLRVVVR